MIAPFLRATGLALAFSMISCVSNARPAASDSEGAGVRATDDVASGADVRATGDARSEATVSSAAGAPTLPGPCISMAEAEGSLEEPEGGVRRFDEGPIDVDGDGAADAVIASEGLCGGHTGNCEWRIYVMRGTCGHLVGAVSGYIVLEPTRTAGLADLWSSWNNGCAGLDRSEMRWRFDGTRYVNVASRACRCPEEDDDAETEEDTCAPWPDAARPSL